jgi:hypothetical protein
MAEENFFEDRQLINLGFFKKKFDKSELEPLISEIEAIKRDFQSGEKFNHNLAGNIEKEFLLSDKTKIYLENLLNPYCIEYDKVYDYVSNYWSILDTDQPIGITKLWVNFQKKHEFNPVHKHSGIYSFVIWIDIPYDIKEEKESASSKHSNCNFPGHFEFIYTDILGRVRNYQIPADKSYNYTMMLFPSQLSHTVYPFFTSDEYRITVSGNFSFIFDHGINK